MSAQIIELVSEASVQRAWDDYLAIAGEVRRVPALLEDADYNIRLARAWKRWRDLFLRMEP